MRQNLIRTLFILGSLGSLALFHSILQAQDASLPTEAHRPRDRECRVLKGDRLLGVIDEKSQRVEYRGTDGRKNWLSESLASMKDPLYDRVRSQGPRLEAENSDTKFCLAQPGAYFCKVKYRLSGDFCRDLKPSDPRWQAFASAIIKIALKEKDLTLLPELLPWEFRSQKDAPTLESLKQQGKETGPSRDGLKLECEDAREDLAVLSQSIDRALSFARESLATTPASDRAREILDKYADKFKWKGGFTPLNWQEFLSWAALREPRTAVTYPSSGFDKEFKREVGSTYFAGIQDSDLQTYWENDGVSYGPTCSTAEGKLDLDLENLAYFIAGDLGWNRKAVDGYSYDDRKCQTRGENVPPILLEFGGLLGLVSDADIRADLQGILEELRKFHDLEHPIRKTIRECVSAGFTGASFR